MRNLSLELTKALLGAFLLAGHVFASAKAVSFSESLTTTYCLFIEQLELADLGGNKLPEFEWLKVSGAIGPLDDEMFINALYDWRIKSRPTEAASRYIPERDMLLKMLREKNEQQAKRPK